jgi:hypothetical protein
VKWEVVCQPKKLGGLGVRDIRAVNISLLAKWRWRLLFDDNALWKEVLKGKYGDSVIGSVELGVDCKPWFSSLWWKDICGIGSNLGNDWLSSEIIRKMGNGANTKFWKDCWLGPIPLCAKFPCLFSISLQKEETIANLLSPNVAEGWNFSWRRRLFVWETGLLEELLLSLRSVVLSTGEDEWGWRPELGGEFSVRSAYALVSGLLIDRVILSTDAQTVFNAIWKCYAPSKVLGFVWMLLHDRVPTRLNLFRRKVITEIGDTSCVFCGEETETVTHLFLYCKFISQVWERVFAWLGLDFSLPHSINSLLHFVMSTTGRKQVRKGLISICCAVLWTIWRHRNNIIFDNGGVNGRGLLDDVMITSWKWWIGRGNSQPCLYYEWFAEPGLCLHR